MVVVVGPSGVGKDSLMAFAAGRLAGRADIGFVRRAITRPGDAGGETHEPVSPEAFAAMVAAGRFAVSWRAHGHSYGIPGDTLDTVRVGRTLIANGSRAALDGFVAAYPRLEVVTITASRERLFERLRARGRESELDILARLDRAQPPLPVGLSLHEIDNSGDLLDAGQRMVALIEDIAARTV
ncbi:MAG: phosphonate metabolism protein/1,5-bisphosphokinase (PRPP-forming) PhnN [Proteobacteria bacterium]|nr:phosphonate metabolism protein/1,5-bisphosphokinase (PRPP-forming) PhnN [Pseudomonadota bacterium]